MMKNEQIKNKNSLCLNITEMKNNNAQLTFV